MVTTKRQRQKDSERYVDNTGIDNIGLFTDFEPIGVDSARDDISMRTVAQPQPQAQAPATQPVRDQAQAAVNYSTLDDRRVVNAAPATEKKAEKRASKKPFKKPGTTDQNDLMPSIKTQRYGKAKVNVEPEESTAKKSNFFDARTKVMLAVYVAIALALAIAVIATGISISATAAEADALSQQVSVKQVRLTQAEEALDEILDPEYKRAQAEDLGMIDAGTPEYYVDKMADADYQAATPRTDGFDKFADWMSKVFA